MNFSSSFQSGLKDLREFILYMTKRSDAVFIYHVYDKYYTWYVQICTHLRIYKCPAKRLGKVQKILSNKFFGLIYNKCNTHKKKIYVKCTRRREEI